MPSSLGYVAEDFVTCSLRGVTKDRLISRGTSMVGSWLACKAKMLCSYERLAPNTRKAHFPIISTFLNTQLRRFSQSTETVMIEHNVSILLGLLSIRKNVSTVAFEDQSEAIPHHLSAVGTFCCHFARLDLVPGLESACW